MGDGQTHAEELRREAEVATQEHKENLARVKRWNLLVEMVQDCVLHGLTLSEHRFLLTCQRRYDYQRHTDHVCLEELLLLENIATRLGAL